MQVRCGMEKLPTLPPAIIKIVIDLILFQIHIFLHLSIFAAFCQCKLHFRITLVFRANTGVFTRFSSNGIGCEQLAKNHPSSTANTTINKEFLKNFSDLPRKGYLPKCVLILYKQYPATDKNFVWSRAVDAVHHTQQLEEANLE